MENLHTDNKQVGGKEVPGTFIQRHIHENGSEVTIDAEANPLKVTLEGLGSIAAMVERGELTLSKDAQHKLVFGAVNALQEMLIAIIVDRDPSKREHFEGSNR